MSKYELVKKEFDKILTELLNDPVYKKILSGDINKKFYINFIVQSGLLAGHNPQIQAYATMHFKGSQKELVKGFLKHAASECGHDQLAYNDAVTCGLTSYDVKTIKPYYETTSLTALPLYMIQFVNPVAYLGYLFYLEFLPTAIGLDVMPVLQKIGVPQDALTFIHDHATIDVGHNKLMVDYVEKLIVTEQDYTDVLYTMRTTAYLHTLMIKRAQAES